MPPATFHVRVFEQGRPSFTSCILYDFNGLILQHCPIPLLWLSAGRDIADSHSPPTPASPTSSLPHSAGTNNRSIGFTVLCAPGPTESFQFAFIYSHRYLMQIRGRHPSARALSSAMYRSSTPSRHRSSSTVEHSKWTRSTCHFVKKALHPTHDACPLRQPHRKDRGYGMRWPTLQ